MVLDILLFWLSDNTVVSYLSCLPWCDRFRDKDNNSAVISLGEPCSDAAAVQQLSSAAVTDAATVDDALLAPSHRVTVNRCGSPPTGRSVSFKCGQGDDISARVSCRRQSEQRDMVAVPSLAVTSSPCAVHHVEDEKSCRLESSRADTSPSDVHVCYCVNSPPASKLSDVDGCIC